MAFVNYTTNNLAVKVVYYGPGLSGKTTNLRYIYFKLDASSRGDLVCLETDTERTFFFDLLPIRAGLIGEFKVHFQLLTVPGQVFYEASRKSVLKGSDGIIFVADSQIPLLDANLESFDGLRRNLLEQDVDLNQVPLVFQYNKRDLDHLIPVETFNSLLNPRRVPFIEASALNGWGVFEALKEIAKLTIPTVREKVLGDRGKPDQKEIAEKRMDEYIEKEGQRRKEAKDAKVDVDFASPGTAAPIKVSKIRIKHPDEIEKEIERLAREFTGKK